MTDVAIQEEAGKLSIEQFQAVLPTQFKKSVNQELVDAVNKVSDPEFREQYRDNVLGYCSVMQQGKFKVKNYLDAVRYVSYKLMGDSNRVAYTRTFSDKVQGFHAKGVSEKDIASYITAYNKSKLVNLIFAQTMVPSYVLNQDLYQKALNVNADLMINAKSEKVRVEAANSILAQLKQPEVAKVELDVNVKQDSAIDALRQTTLNLVAEQKKMMQAGAMDAKDVAHSRIIDGEAEVVDV